MTVDFTYFKVVLTPSSGSSPGDGFVDNKTVKDYISYKDATDSYGEGWPSSEDNALAKARANLRWKNIIFRATTLVSPIDIKVTKNEGGSGDAAPTSFEFVIITDRPESYRLEDTENPGKWLVGTDTVKRLVALALTDTMKTNALVYLPQDVSPNVTSTEAVPKIHYGESIQVVEVGPIASDLKTAEGMIEVSVVETTGQGEPEPEKKDDSSKDSKDSAPGASSPSTTPSTSESTTPSTSESTTPSTSEKTEGSQAEETKPASTETDTKNESTTQSGEASVTSQTASSEPNKPA